MAEPAAGQSRRFTILSSSAEIGPPPRLPSGPRRSKWRLVTRLVTLVANSAAPLSSRHHDEDEGKRLLRELGRIKWLIWHGNQHRACQRADGPRDDAEALELDYPHLGRFTRAAHEFAVYLAGGRGSLCRATQNRQPSLAISLRVALANRCSVSVEVRLSRRHAPPPVRALASRPRQPEQARSWSDGGGVSAPHFLMVPKLGAPGRGGALPQSHPMPGTLQGPSMHRARAASAAIASA